MIVDTKNNLASTILQSIKINKKNVLDSLIFWGSVHFVNQNKNPANYF